jgi:hypothetical protein
LAGWQYPAPRNWTVFWDIMPCSPLKVNRCSGGTLCLPSSGLHGIIVQKIILFITTAVRTTNPTWITTDWSYSGRFCMWNTSI